MEYHAVQPVVVGDACKRFNAVLSVRYVFLNPARIMLYVNGYVPEQSPMCVGICLTIGRTRIWLWKATCRIHGLVPRVINVGGYETHWSTRQTDSQLIEQILVIDLWTRNAIWVPELLDFQEILHGQV